jgi:hypothetical protein
MEKYQTNPPKPEKFPLFDPILKDDAGVNS